MNVWEATQQRLATVFEEFDNVVVAFSGGKDSGVMLNATLDFMRRNEITKPVTVMHLDYEGQYTATTDYVTEVMTSGDPLIDPLWICLPIAAGCAVSMFQDHWKPWDPAKRDLWVRDLSEAPGVIHVDNVPDGFPEFDGVWDYTFQEQIARWLHRRSGAARTAVLVGIREQESLHRYAAINREDKHATYDGLRWTTRIFNDVYNAYPIHDWLTEDVWTANARFGWSYNALYDLFHQAGLSIHQMRVASPFNDAATESLKLYRVIEPAMWARLVGRVNGANFAAIYGGTSAMGAKSITLPPGHTWKSYAEFLLSTLPSDLRARYEKKFETSLRYWTEKDGGALPVETATEVREALGEKAEYLGAPTSKRNYSRPHEMVRFKDYPDDIPGISDFNAVPTYKRMCITILKNDHTCKTMGFGLTKLEMDKRKAAVAKYKEIL